MHSLPPTPYLSGPPVQALALSRGCPGQGCREHLHPPQWLPCPPEQVHTEVSRPRVQRVGGGGFQTLSVICLSSPHPREALDLSDIDSEPPRGSFPSLEPRNLLSLFEDSLGPA